MVSLEELYDALMADGAPLPLTYAEFKDYMTSGPNGGYTHRKQVYDALKADGAPLPDTYEDFSKALFAPKYPEKKKQEIGGKAPVAPAPPKSLLPTPDSTAASLLKTPIPKDTIQSAPATGSQAGSVQPEEPVVETTGGNTNEGDDNRRPSAALNEFRSRELAKSVNGVYSKIDGLVDSSRRRVESMTQRGRDRQKAGETRARMAGLPTKVLGLSPGAAGSESGGSGSEGSSSVSRNTVSPKAYGAKMVDGVMKTEWLLPDGSVSTNFGDADTAEYRARKARLQDEFLKRMKANGLDPARHEDVEAQKQKDLLDDSEKRVNARLGINEEKLRAIHDKRAERLDESMKWDDSEGFWDNMARILGGSIKRGMDNQHPVDRPVSSLTDEDEDIRNLTTENQTLEEARKLLETRKLKKSYGFMGGFWKVGNNLRNMKMGAGHTLSDADFYSGGIMALQKRSQLMEIEEKLKQGRKLSDSELSLIYSTMIGQDVRNNIDTPHGYTAAQTIVEMFPFMAQMMLNPASGLSKALVNKFGKSGLKKIALIVAGDVAESAVLANTLQAPATFADAMERYQGDVVEGKNGLEFDGSHNWATSIAKAQGAATIENFTEMLGEHFGVIKDFAGKMIGKGVSKLGGGKIVNGVTDLINKINTTDWAKAVGNLEKRAHWSGSVGEVLEEEAGIVLNSLFVGDNSFHDLVDADQQIDIVLGVGLFGGFVSGVKTLGYPVQRAKAKSRLRKRDGIAGWRFGEDWSSMREDIDSAEEGDLSGVVRGLINKHAKSNEQARAIVEYAEALMRARGYDLASATAVAEGTMTPEQQDANESYEHGADLAENGEPQEMRDARVWLDRCRERFVRNSSEDFVAEHFDGDDAVENLTKLGEDEELRRNAADYVNARYVYNGMIQRVRDDIDSRVAQSDAQIESRVNRQSGMIQPAVMKDDDRKVYVVSGNVVMFDDGTAVDASNSSKDIIVMDAETGKVEFADPSRLLSVGEALDPEAEKAMARNEITQEIAQTAANNIDGVLSFAPGETYSVLDMDGNPEEITILGNSADEEGMPVDWSVDIQYPDGTIQSVATADLQQWVDAANERRVTQFAEERDAERAAADEAERQADQSGLSNPNRNTNLLPDNWKMPYYDFNTTAARYIESDRGTGGMLYQDEQGNDAIVISAIDENNYVGYFREYDDQGNPTNRWSAKFLNGSGLRENHRDMMQTAQELLPAGHELTEHTSVSTDGLRNLANQLKHGYEIQRDEEGNVVTNRVAVNMMARENALGIPQYRPGSETKISVRLEEDERAEVNARLARFLAPFGLDESAIHWEGDKLYVEHPVLRRADTPQQEAEEAPGVPKTEESVPNTGENAEIEGQNVPEAVSTDDGFIPIDPDVIIPLAAEVEAMLAPDAEAAATTAPTSEAAPEEKPSALSQIPTDEKGKPKFGEVAPETAWNALVEKTQDDEMAQNYADQKVRSSKKALEKAEKVKPKELDDIDEFIASEIERKASIEKAKAALQHWEKVATTKQRRQAEADAIRNEETRRRAEERRIAEEQARAEREEAERQELEALNGVSDWSHGVPDWSHDTPQDARARGYRRVGAAKIDRQEPVEALRGKEVEVKFAENELPKGNVALIDVSSLQPSHMEGTRNERHFLDEAQPKERTDAASVEAARNIASGIRPDEVTVGTTAYTGAPTVNTRGEAIQGNNRASALRLMYEAYPEQAAKYRQYLIDHAADFGFTPEQVAGMERPVLVNMLDVADEEAIRLGQFVAQDTESGGMERIKPANMVNKVDMDSFARILLSSNDEDASISQLIDENGIETLKWLRRKKHITETQYQSAFDSRGNLTGEAKNDLQGMLYENIFRGGSTQLREMFGNLPAKAQRAILATAHRDSHSNKADRMITELQKSIMAFNDMMSYPDVVSATNLESARKAADTWSRQYAFDEVSGESVLPSEKYSNFALALAAMYKGGTQRFIQQTFNDLYDTIQGLREEDLATLMSGEVVEKIPVSLAEAISKVLGIEYKPVNRKRNGRNGSDAVDVDSTQGEAGGSGGRGDAEGGERDTHPGQPSDGGRGAQDARSEDGGRGNSHVGGRSGVTTTSGKNILSEENKIVFLDPREMSDEEKNKRGKMLQDAEAIEVALGQIVATQTQSARKVAEQWWDDNVGEATYYDTEVGEVEINRNSVESSLAHRYGQAKLDAITSLVEGFENAVYLGTMPDSRERGVVDHYFAYPINYDGQRCYVFCRAMQDANKNRLYVHEVFVSDNIKKGDTLQTAASKPHGGIALYRDILANVLETVAKTEPQQPNNAVSNDSSLSVDEQSGTSSSEPNGKSTVSNSKVNALSADKQAEGEESSADALTEARGRDKNGSAGEKIAEAEATVNTNPTQAQKEAGNYKKGHVSIDGMRISIENPRGSIRRGKDADGKEWETQMTMDYGYIRGTQGKDKDHIDIFLSDVATEKEHLEEWGMDKSIFVIDQYNKDGTFDEHKVVFGVVDAWNAKESYLENYSKDWAEGRRIDVTEVSMEDFKKWAFDGKRKIKPFAEYKSIKTEDRRTLPTRIEEWRELNGKERMEVAAANPLTEEEINRSNADPVLKANALSYLRGKRGGLGESSYLNVYENVRYSDRDSSADSGTEDATQLAGTDNGLSDRRGDGREGGASAVSVDRGDSPRDVSGERADGKDSEGGSRSDTGAEGNQGVPESAPGVDAVSPGDNGSKGRSNDRGKRGNGRPAGRKGGGSNAGTSGSRSSKTGKGADGKSVASDKKAHLDEFKSLLDEFRRAGRDSLNISVLGMSPRQMELVPKLIVAGARIGYDLLREGVTAFARWGSQMRELLGKPLKISGFTDAEIDEWIHEMWECAFPVDGEVHTIGEWASIIGREELRDKIRMSLDEKRELQRAAEGIKVKIGDRENIAATLPFLLPQQQDDVAKAEMQFFDESHADREHGHGKGFMFTNGTGTGKTYTGLGIVKRFVKEGKGRILILTPSQPKVKDWINDGKNLGLDLRSLDDWAKERGTNATNEAGEGVVVTTYANFRQNDALMNGTFDLIVYDESHRLLENKRGEANTGASQHYKISNRNSSYAFTRLQSINPVWREYQKKIEEFNDEFTRIVDKAKRSTGKDNFFDLKVNQLVPPFFQDEWSSGDERRFPEMAKLRSEIRELGKRFEEVEKPKIEAEAEEAVKRTKVVFLSATPFNTRENIDYAEGYIFSYPERSDNGMSGRTRFFLDHFGSAYKFRYHRLENRVSNPAAVARQEVEFSDYLQNTLGTMSGRIIDSEYDYSRDFPTVTGEYAPRFNEAISVFSKSDSMRQACWNVMSDYLYSSALFESMKVNQILPRIEEHLKLGRKVVIFHRRVESKPLDKPFAMMFDQARHLATLEKDEALKQERLKEIKRLRSKFKDLLEWEKTIDLSMPRDQLVKHFGKDNVLLFSGKETARQKNEAIDKFNDDDLGKNIIVIQEASGKEGISLHDRTGKHQRVLITLALPQSPITALQTEGRIYRIGNMSNAIFEYPLLGLDSELTLFGQRFNSQVGTTENLALGSKARNLRESFTRGIEERSGEIDPSSQGLGGKEFDAADYFETDEFERAVLDFYANQKLSGSRDSREGKDYFPTPEPLGYMMARWGHIAEGESVLEPSAGHGAIARYVPMENSLTAIEPSTSLFSKLQLKAGGLGRKFENTVFEDYNVINKHDVVLMNPPFGTGGRLAVDHVAKAFSHLEEGGRVVAIIPRGSTDSKFDKWYEGQKDAVVTGEILLPSITFSNAGTSVMARVVVIDKVSDKGLAQTASSRRVNIDLSGRDFSKIEDIFEAIRDIQMPERTIDRKARMRKKALVAARELRKIVGEDNVRLTDSELRISGRGMWENLQWGDREGKDLEDYLKKSFVNFTRWMKGADSRGKEKQVAMYGELRDLSTKMLGKSVEELDQEFSTGIGGNVAEEEKGVYMPSLFDNIDGGKPAPKRVMIESPSLFDFSEDGKEEISAEDKRIQEEADRRTDEANRHIDDFLDRGSEIAARYRQYAELRPELRDEIFSRMFEEIEGASEELRNHLQLFYLEEGNTQSDAENMARDMAARVMAQLRLNEDIPLPSSESSKRKGEEMSDPQSGKKTSSESGKEELVTASGERIGFERVQPTEDKGEKEDRETRKRKLRKLEPGEFCYVERQFSETHEFNFTGKERIESVDDIAYIFRNLEDYSIENAFVVLVKDGKPVIVHIGMGGPVETLVDFTAIRGALDAYGADKVYFVHNHPTGNLKPSVADRKIAAKMKEMVGSDKLADCIIIDVTSGKYSVFGTDYNKEHRVDSQQREERSHTVIKQDRQNRTEEGKDVSNLTKISGSDDVARFVSEKRLGTGNKINYLLLARNNTIIGNLHTRFENYGADTKELADEMVRMGVHYGASVVIPYGNVKIVGNEISALGRAISSMSGGSLHMLDAMSIDSRHGGGHMSASDYGMIRESEEEYFRDPEEDVEKINEKFNEDLKRFEAGELDDRFRFELGMPSSYLLSAGFPYLPISMRKSLLEKKSQQSNHPFDSADVQDLVNAIQRPLAIFRYSKENVKNLIISLEREGKHFLVGITLGFKRDGLEINSISGLFPKQNHEWIKWIQDGIAIRIDQKEKVLNLIDSLRINPAEATRIGLDLDNVAKIVENFENPPILGEESSGRQKNDLTEADITNKLTTFDKHNQTSSNGEEREEEEALHQIQHKGGRGNAKDSGGESERGREEVELRRDGRGAYTDAEVSFENDPWSRAWGESLRSLKKQRQYAERMRKYMRGRVEELAKQLGLDIEIVEDGSSLRSDNNQGHGAKADLGRGHGSAQGLGGGSHADRNNERKSKAKGWYDTTKRKITIILGNHKSIEDIEATVLHEGVAHHGLRKMFGEKFDAFLDAVYDHAENGIKERIDALAIKNGWNRRVATEEYLAQLAEETDFENTRASWWDKIKNLFMQFLMNCGFSANMTITDNELRYVLWMSWRNLQSPGLYSHFLGVAEKVAKEYELGVGNFAEAQGLDKNRDTASPGDKQTSGDKLSHEGRQEAADMAADGILFRDGDFTPHDRVLATDFYENTLATGKWQFREAMQDSMLGLKTLYEAVLTGGDESKRKDFHIKEVAGYKNAYLFENRMSSTNNTEQHEYFSQFMKPLLETIHDICGNSGEERRALTDYMMAKHGLERNEYMRNEAIARNKKLKPGEKPEVTNRDFAGLCGLTGEKDWKKAELAAQQMVDDYERDHDSLLIDKLWKETKSATTATLEKIYVSGLISEDTFNKVLDMYDYYIPLRGWDEKLSNEEYGYLTGNDSPLMGNVFKKSGGRRSKADDPIATMAKMADDAIRQGNRNVMKQRFLNFVLENPSDLVSVSELWMRYDDVTDEWTPVFANLDEGMSPGEVAAEISKFEENMEKLKAKEPDKYKRGRDARHIPFKVMKNNLREHQVLVQRNGRTYVLTINGNPRAAQALNGLTNPDTDAKGIEVSMKNFGSIVNRELSALYTTRNPDFVMSNFTRDMIYSNTQVWVKEDPRYALQFRNNCGKFSPFSPRRTFGLEHGLRKKRLYSMGMLFRKWENGTLDMNDKYEKMFKEFMLNGGETGYTSVKDIERYKKTIAAELKRQGNVARSAWGSIGMGIDIVNRSVENCARFAAYVTSREMGRTIDRSIWDAKEITVNFNKKGSGGKFFGAPNQTLLGNVGAAISWAGRWSFAFWNAGIQGVTNYLSGVKHNPRKAIPASLTLFGLGMGILFLNLALMSLFGGDDDDDENAYFNLPDNVRRNNVCVKFWKQYVAIPLPIEYRFSYGLGELAAGVLTGNEHYTKEELTLQLMTLASQVMPIDVLEGGARNIFENNGDGIQFVDIVHPFVPTALKPVTEAYIFNKGWTGLPIANTTEFNKRDPEYLRVFKSTDHRLVEALRWVNSKTGGNDHRKGTIDFNPAKIEYLLKGYLGGVFSFPSEIVKTVETAAGKRDFEWKNTPLLNRVVKAGDERTAYRKINNEFFKYRNEAETTKHEYDGFMKDKKKGILGAAAQADLIMNSERFLRYQIYEAFEPGISVLTSAIKEETDPAEKAQFEKMLNERRRDMVEAMHDPEAFLKKIGAKQEIETTNEKDE